MENKINQVPFSDMNQVTDASGTIIFSVMTNPYNKGAIKNYIVVNRGQILSGHETRAEALEAAKRYADIREAFSK
jgi:hypothetical protein